MNNTPIHRIRTVTEFHRLRGLPPPEHPLISVVNYADIVHSPENYIASWVFDFYSISLKRGIDARIRYGQQDYDFDEGVMFFIAPGQVFRIEVEQGSSSVRSGWMLLVHPDFLWNTPLAKSIRQYEFFGYAVHEALFLSDKEETTVSGIIQQIRQEYHSNIDPFSLQIILSQLETLLTYASRFYQRQFLTRKKACHEVLDRLERLLDEHFRDDAREKGLPSVQHLADQLHMSPDYLSSLLKVLTGQNTRQLIQDRLIGQAKEKLSTTTLSVSEIAYELGFEHLQSFSKLFKAKTSLSPIAFRQSFN